MSVAIIAALAVPLPSAQHQHALDKQQQSHVQQRAEINMTELRALLTSDACGWSVQYQCTAALSASARATCEMRTCPWLLIDEPVDVWKLANEHVSDEGVLDLEAVESTCTTGFDTPCCPVGNNKNTGGEAAMCGGAARGECVDIVSWLKAQDEDDQECTWPIQFQAAKCLCKGNFEGLSCDGCKAGWAGTDCTEVATAVRMNLDAMSDEQMTTFMTAVDALERNTDGSGKTAYPEEYWHIRLMHQMHRNYHEKEWFADLYDRGILPPEVQSDGELNYPVWPWFLPFHTIYFREYENLLRRVSGQQHWVMPIFNMTNAGHVAVLHRLEKSSAEDHLTDCSVPPYYHDGKYDDEAVDDTVACLYNSTTNGAILATAEQFYAATQRPLYDETQDQIRITNMFHGTGVSATVTKWYLDSRDVTFSEAFNWMHEGYHRAYFNYGPCRAGARGGFIDQGNKQATEKGFIMFKPFATDKYDKDDTGFCYMTVPMHLWYDEELKLMKAAGKPIAPTKLNKDHDVNSARDEWEPARQLLTSDRSLTSPSMCVRWLFPMRKMRDIDATTPPLVDR